MTDQSTAAAERSAHVVRDVAERTCCVCGKVLGAGYAARVVPPLAEVCSVRCAGMAPFQREAAHG